VADRELDVLVVGAGLSGLCAAGDLEAAGRSVLVLEATDRVGGKMRTEEVGGDHVDLGAHWIGPGQDRIAALARELGVRTERQPLQGRQVLLLDGKRHLFAGTVPLMSPPVMADVGVGVLWLWRLHRGLSFSGAGRRRDLDAMTLEQLKRRVFRTRRARAVFDMAIALMSGADPCELSALHALAMIESGGGLKRLSDFEGGAQQDFFVGGAQQICQLLAERLERPVALGAAVTAIEQDGEGVTVTTPVGSHRVAYAVVAVAPPMAWRIAFSPPLPPERDAYMQRAAMGAYTKVVATYDRPWWRDHGLNGIALSTDGPVQMIVDGGARSGQGILVGFVTGAAAHAFSRLDAGERRRSALEAFVRLLGPPAGQVDGYLDFAWGEQPWFRGPVSYPAPGALSRLGDLPHEPTGRIHWAGTDLATKNHGYMDGAVQSGRRAAREVAARWA
jgi:monoamine oxidase